MATLHVIYDPYDAIRTDPEMEKRLRMFSARISLAQPLPVDPSPEDRSSLHDLAVQLATLLLQEMVG